MSKAEFVAATGLGKLEVVQTPIPEPGDNQVVIKVEYSTLSPFDLYCLDKGFYVQKYPHVFGVNGAGTIFKVGANVDDLKVGDRVVAFTKDFDNKGMQAYTLQSRSVIAKVPESVPLEKAVTIPDNFITAFYTIFNQLELPIPTELPSKATPPKANAPIMIYGAGSTSGQYDIELLRLAGYKNIVAVASKHHESYLRKLGATAVVDYKSPSFVQEVAAAAGGDGKVELVADSIAMTSTFEHIAKVIRPGGLLAYLVPFKYGSKNLSADEGELTVDVPEDVKAIFPEGVRFITVRTFNYQEDKRLADTLAPVILRNAIEKELIQPNRIKLFDQGDLLTRLSAAFDLLRSNTVSGEKVVVKITP